MLIEIKDSKIQGKGAFVAKDVKKGEIVLDWKNCSKEISREEFNQLSDDEKQYVSIIKGKHLLFFEPARFFNHSCEPNTKVDGHYDVAIRDIKKGEEITVDYFAEKVPIRFKCNCGSDKCKGIVENV